MVSPSTPSILYHQHWSLTNSQMTLYNMRKPVVKAFFVRDLHE